MREIGEALRILFGKLSEFLDVFDLSFLISGGTAFMAVLYLAWSLGVDVSTIPKEPTVFFVGMFVILAVYVCGLICFALGRSVRRGLQSAKAPWYGFGKRGEFADRRLEPVVFAHALDKEERLAHYFDGEGNASPYLYVRMWAELRHDPLREPSMSLLNHYWKLAATYDGLAAALLLWIGIFLTTAVAPPTLVVHSIVPLPVSLGLALVATIAFFGCCGEARRYDQYQLEELAASIAAVPPRPPAPPSEDPANPLPPLAALARLNSAMAAPQPAPTTPAPAATPATPQAPATPSALEAEPTQ